MRLRVERGAFRLLLHDARLVDVALDCGFQNHETFIRAFRRVFGKTPSEYREWIRRQVFERNHQAREASAEVGSAFELSPTKIVRLRSMRVSKRLPMHGTACLRARRCTNALYYHDGGIPAPNQKW